jgi:hypothetical protein
VESACCGVLTFIVLHGKFERDPRDVTDYNDCIEHETLRVAIIGMMEEPATPGAHASSPHEPQIIIILLFTFILFFYVLFSSYQLIGIRVHERNGGELPAELRQVPRLDREAEREGRPLDEGK